MNLTLDAASEQVIQRELDLGHYNNPAEVVARALQLREAEADWLLANREAINQRLDESFAQIERGEGLTGDQLREFLAERRASRHR